MPQKEMDCSPAARIDVDPLLRTDPHSGHVWCSTFPVHVTEPRSQVMQKTMNNPMLSDGTAGKRYTQTRSSVIDTGRTISMAQARSPYELTAAPHSMKPSQKTDMAGRRAENDWMNSVVKRGHQSAGAVNSTVRANDPPAPLLVPRMDAHLMSSVCDVHSSTVLGREQWNPSDTSRPRIRSCGPQGNTTRQQQSRWRPG